MRRFFLGVDGGQSSTTALIANETGRILGRGRGGPCNHVRTPEGHEKFMSAVGGSLRDACLAAGLDDASVIFASACLGFSGGPEDKDPYSRELIRSARYKITNDAEIALSGATAGQPGIIVIAGTGSIAYGRNARGDVARAGGWGYVFGDEGSAFDLVRQALREVLRFEEGRGEPTILRALLLEATGASDANELLHLFYTSGYPRAKVASFASLVTRAAELGDRSAQDVLDHAAQQLASLAEAVYQRLFPSGDRIPVAYVGGVFESNRLLSAFKDRVRESIQCSAEPPRFSPAAGAVLDALRLDGNASELSGVPGSE